MLCSILCCVVLCCDVIYDVECMIYDLRYMMVHARLGWAGLG